MLERALHVLALFQYMYSRPFRLVHCVLQATVQVWHPMHLLRSITIASWRVVMAPPLRLSGVQLRDVHRGVVGVLVPVPARPEPEVAPAVAHLEQVDEPGCLRKTKGL